MNDQSDNSSVPDLGEGFRWYGPADPVPLRYIRQAGASEIFTSLHQIPYGELWPREAIRERKEQVAAAGLRWSVAESVPVHEDLKVGTGDLRRLFDNYATTLRNLAAEGIHTVVYNFMPVLDWIRTEMRMVLPDGAECLQFNPVHFAAFEIHALKRDGAESDYTAAQVEAAAAWWDRLESAARDTFVDSIIDVFPGVKWGLTLDDIRVMLSRYEGLSESQLRDNLKQFVGEVVPVAEEVGVRLALHPDDPPFPVLGLPRIVSRAPDIAQILAMADCPAHGLCFCTGSLSVLAENDLPAMVREFGPRIHSLHLRSTQRCPDGSFFEASHLAGSVDMPAVVSALLSELDRRVAEGRVDARLIFRPDHGHTIMDDLSKRSWVTPGYSCIGRARGLAELRGLLHGLKYTRRASFFQ